MENSKTEDATYNDLIATFQDKTPITILIQDLKETSNLLKSDFQKDVILSIVKVLQESSKETERNIMVKFAFDFYADLSCQMGVPENLISENLTHAENFFDEKFNK